MTTPTIAQAEAEQAAEASGRVEADPVPMPRKEAAERLRAHVLDKDTRRQLLNNPRRYIDTAPGEIAAILRAYVAHLDAQPPPCSPADPCDEHRAYGMHEQGRPPIDAGERGGEYERGRKDERAAVVTFLREEQEKHARASDIASDESRARLWAKSTVLVTMMAYLDRGDHVRGAR
ncbi:MAG TPA: hypothetical protein VNI01_13080 [Elusimicrobiota bacterium]|jgi:hypothetical protein|nr:hypothetical protein [Elusimicrobiota bacterium]